MISFRLAWCSPKLKTTSPPGYGYKTHQVKNTKQSKKCEQSAFPLTEALNILQQALRNLQATLKRL